MEEELALLRARVAKLEAKQASDFLYLRDTFDRIDVAVNASKSLEEHFIMPMLLRLAGLGHRSEMAEMLAGLAIELQVDEPIPRRELEQRRAAYWKKQVAAMPVWHGFPPSDFYEDGEPED